MPATEIAVVICDSVQIIPVWGQLCARVIGRQRQASVQLRLVSTRRKGRRHIICEVQPPHREVDKGVDLVGKPAIGFKSLEMDHQNRWQPSQ